jgi:tetratricopeptide (TPR) repeat protein
MHSAGVLAFDLERFDDSRYWLEKGAEAGNPRCAGVLGKNLHDLGRTEEAIEVLKQGMEQTSLSSYLQLALIYNERGDTALARETLLQAPTKDEIEHRESHLLIYVEQLLAAIR